MKHPIIVTAGKTPALEYASQKLKQAGFVVSTAPLPRATHLLLPVPSFESNGQIKGGEDLKSILSKLPDSITVIGGNLSQPELDGYNTVDLLQDEEYLTQNAHITAHCALGIAIEHAPFVLESQPVLVIGWGRIGKKLAQLLRAIGAKVTVATRKESSRAALTRDGYTTIATQDIQPDQYCLIFNTAPAMVLSNCTGDSLKIDLASQLGMAADDVIWARGLPNKHTPISSGQLIADSVISYLSKKEVSP